MVVVKVGLEEVLMKVNVNERDVVRLVLMLRKFREGDVNPVGRKGALDGPESLLIFRRFGDEGDGR